MTFRVRSYRGFGDRRTLTMDCVGQKVIKPFTTILRSLCELELKLGILILLMIHRVLSIIQYSGNHSSWLLGFDSWTILCGPLSVSHRSLVFILPVNSSP